MKGTNSTEKRQDITQKKKFMPKRNASNGMSMLMRKTT